MVTLFDFSQPAAPEPREESVPLGPVPIRNYPLVCQHVAAAFAKDPEHTAVTLNSNGSTEATATEYFLRRVLH